MFKANVSILIATAAAEDVTFKEPQTGSCGASRNGESLPFYQRCVKNSGDVVQTAEDCKKSCEENDWCVAYAVNNANYESEKPKVWSCQLASKTGDCPDSEWTLYGKFKQGDEYVLETNSKSQSKPWLSCHEKKVAEVVESGNSCKCNGGTPFPDGDAQCTFDGRYACDTCDDGFYLTEGYNGECDGCGDYCPMICRNKDFIDWNAPRCERNRCTCENGTASLNDACPENGTNFCVACLPGFHKTADNRCVPNECFCEKGEAAVGGSKPAWPTRWCLENGREHCGICEDFYVRNPFTKACDPHQCTCNSLELPATGGQVGTPATGPQCVSNGANVCLDCLPTHQMNENQQCELIVVDPTPVPDCEDKGSLCKAIFTYGLCENKDFANGYPQKSCALTCGYCDKPDILVV